MRGMEPGEAAVSDKQINRSIITLQGAIERLEGEMKIFFGALTDILRPALPSPIASTDKVNKPEEAPLAECISEIAERIFVLERATNEIYNRLEI